ncbi:MAG: sigma-70 family RNA polymerase sigma factor [Chitinophagaceae bacterium]|nr:MAG: sigma-70 family RNA polymerase sigma factor [Chitinophagaceae bacterium]
MSTDAAYKLMDHLFRHEAGKMVAILTARFGLAQLQLVEDAVQDAFVQARSAWRIDLPDNPAAWLHRVAGNRAIDLLRREGRGHQIISETDAGTSQEPIEAFSDGELRDVQLQLIFACCHPSLKLEDKLALTLKTVSGFSPAEIARALLKTEAAIQKRLERARAHLRDAAIRLEIPAGAAITTRLDAVVKVLYLLFNEGYNSGKPDEPIRRDLCAEAMRCAKLLCEQEQTAQPPVQALLALMCLHAARFDSRLDATGAMLRLHEQDRASWDRELIAVGCRYLEQASRGDILSRYHLEAAIASCHCLAQSFEATGWKRILSLYDLLLTIDSSPIVQLNRAVALAEVDGPDIAIGAILHIPGIEGLLRTHYLFPAVLGELYARLSAHLRATELLAQAKSLTSSQAEKNMLQRKIDGLGS